VGALVAELPADQVETFTTFGYEYGMAFQVVDDILDLVATTEQLGKPSGNDLVEGVYTLPVIHTLDGSDGDELRNILGTPLDDDQRESARTIVRRGDAIDEATATARAYVANATAALDALGPDPVTDGLQATARYLIERIEIIDAL
jgi:heptaprenyl diphosphate synthase